MTSPSVASRWRVRDVVLHADIGAPLRADGTLALGSLPAYGSRFLLLSNLVPLDRSARLVRQKTDEGSAREGRRSGRSARGSNVSAAVPVFTHGEGPCTCIGIPAVVAVPGALLAFGQC